MASVYVTLTCWKNVNSKLSETISLFFSLPLSVFCYPLYMAFFPPTKDKIPSCGSGCSQRVPGLHYSTTPENSQRGKRRLPLPSGIILNPGKNSDSSHMCCAPMTVIGCPTQDVYRRNNSSTQNSRRLAGANRDSGNGEDQKKKKEKDSSSQQQERAKCGGCGEVTGEVMLPLNSGIRCLDFILQLVGHLGRF